MPLKGQTSGNRAAPVRAAATVTALIDHVVHATVEIKILSGFLLAVSLVLFGGTFTYRTCVELADSVQWVAHTQEVRATLANLYGSLAGAELAQRDYLLTAQQVRLDEYVRLAKVVQDHLAELGGLTSDNPAQQRDWAALKSAVQSRLDEMRSEEHTSELQSRLHLVCRLLLEKKK